MTYSVLGIDTQTGQRVEIPKPSRLQGLYIIGIQGTGKSGLIENLIINDIKQGTGLAVLDPHGDLINAVLARMDRREQDVILLDISDEDYPFGLNLFECSNPKSAKAVQIVIDQVMHIFEKLFDVSRQTPRMAQYLRNCTHTLVANPGSTMAEIPLLLADEQCRRRLVANVTNPQVRLFWQQYERMRPQEQYEEARSTLNKLDEFLQGLTFNNIAQSKTTINFRDVMDKGKILLVKLDATLESVTSLIGSLIIAQFLNAAYSRTELPVNKRRHFNLYADEFQRFATEDFATLLTEARKFGIATTIAHQARYQPGMTDGIRATSLSAANLVVFKVNSKDADELAGQFQRTPPPPEVEWIEEGVGIKPVKTYKRDVVGHLLKQGHEDERVMAFVRDYLEVLERASHERIREVRKEDWSPYGGSHHWIEYVYPINHLGIEYNPETIPRILKNLSAWLFTGMRDRDALWQPLPSFTFWYLAHFFGFEAIYKALYEYSKYDGELKYWLDFLTKYPLNGEAFKNSGFDSDEYIKTAVAAIDDALIDFVATLFPNLSRASIQAARQQTVIDLAGCVLPEVQDRGFVALELITSALRQYADRHPALDVVSYKKRFHEELSRPAIAVDVFFPAILLAHRNVKPYSASFPLDSWRITHRTYEFLLYNKTETKKTYTYDLELYKSALYLALMEEIPNFLKPFLRYIRFCAALHLTQLALSQQPLETMDTGRYEPDVRKHPIITQRSYPEMESLIANELTNLHTSHFEKFAKVKIVTDNGNEEHTIRTLDPKQQPEKPLFGQALQARLTRIKQQNIQERYVRPRLEVEEEIRVRQAQCSKPPQEPPDEPPISRRPPR